MRFLKDGPSIPDDLLIARDEGRVVFFCGAGVSKARAGLVDFLDLAERVIHDLGVPSDHKASLILNEARDIHERIGVSGLISVDGIFGLLEHDFLTCDIEQSVSKVLKPGNTVDLSAHRIIIDLAKTPDDKVHLITTNFDLLFEDCCKSPNIWHPPKLPDPSRHIEMDGIIHLHGCVNKDYSGPEGDGFILSSSQFGSAYLSDGWATRFIREIIGRYVVVFIGYTADDPPIKYLLEALKRKTGRLDGVYAFQSGLSNEVTANWQHKGVKAIPYLENDEHRALWDTLSAWAERARAPNAWYKSIIDLAKNGPVSLQPHERGQVAHIVSTVDGVRKFLEGNEPLPAEWLCVFDPSCRYGRPGHIWESSEQKSFVDPFDFYGLDDDLVPKKINPDDPYEKRETPSTAWDAFEANRLDRQNLKDDSFASIRGHWAINMPRLSPRLFAIGEWIMRVADQPAAIWWAARQNGLHPNIQDSIQWKLSNSNGISSSFIRKAWSYLFEAWIEKKKKADNDWYHLETIIAKDGWDERIVRELAAINRPYIKVEHNYWEGPIPPKLKKDASLRDLLSLNVEYSKNVKDIKIPDEWIETSVQEFRKNLELALQLETEIGGYGLHNICPIIRDDTDENHGYARTYGLSGSIIFFSSLFEHLITFNIASAKRELKTWPVNDDTIFSHLRIWAANWRELVPDKAFGSFISELSDSAFWGSYHQRDLLILLARRWNCLDTQTRKDIENRLLQGRTKWAGENDSEFKENKAWATANRLLWLDKNGCEFSFDLDVEINKLKRIATEWKPEYAAKAANSIEGRGGFVKIETEHSVLLNEPVSNILKKAQELSGRTDDFLVEKNPFAGLCAERPARAFAALMNAAKHEEYPEWAWRTFLNAEARKNDKARLWALIAELILRCPDEIVAQFIRPASDWLLNVSQNLSNKYPEKFDRIISKLINVLRLELPGSSSAIVRGNKEIDWAMEALNAPGGKLAEALFKDDRIKDLQVGKGFPDNWLKYVNELLSLNGDFHRHALVILAYSLNWFYAIDPIWTETNILSVLEKDDELDKSAVWSGFFWHASVPNQKLYMRLKPHLLTLSKQSISRGQKYNTVLAGFILAGWGSKDKETGESLISNNEMRDVLLSVNDEFRVQIIWQAERWFGHERNESDIKWSEKIIELFSDVWPRQKSAKTPKISAALCNFAFSSTENFKEIVEVILPLLSKIEPNHLILYELTKPENKIVDLYPKQTLVILYSVLPDNITIWPYGIDSILKRLSEADDDMKRDERLIEIMRKWNSR